MFCSTFSKVCLLCKIVLNSSVLMSKHNVSEGIYMQHVLSEKQKQKQYLLCFQEISFMGWLMVVALVAHLLLTGSTSFHLPAVLIIVWKSKDYKSLI